MRRWTALCGLVVSLAVAASAACIGFGFNAKGPLASATNVYVPPGRSDATYAVLKARGVIARGSLPRFVFRLAVEMTRRSGAVRSGEYRFPQHASLRAVLAILHHGKPVQHLLTIPEGLTAQRIRQIIAKAPFMSGNVPDFDEGAVLPQTISYLYGADRGQIVTRLHMMLEQNLTEIWAERQSDLPLKSKRDLLILASIVERETSRPEERGIIARVFLNRLSKSMKLQSDPTVIYDVSHGVGVLHRPLTRSDLAFDAGHNTYVRAGLPEGPICAPGKASLVAVAQPPANDALYFVAAADGGRHVFSSTLQAHLQAVKLYRKYQRDRTKEAASD